MSEKITVVFKDEDKGIVKDVEVPCDVTVVEFVHALNSAYDLGIHLGELEETILISENPIVLLKGNKTLEEYGITQGSVIVRR